jgi:hypothetical protein
MSSSSSAISASRFITLLASRATMAAANRSPGSVICWAWAAAVTVWAKAAASWSRTLRLASQAWMRVAPARRIWAGAW